MTDRPATNAPDTRYGSAADTAGEGSAVAQDFNDASGSAGEGSAVEEDFSEAEQSSSSRYDGDTAGEGSATEQVSTQQNKGALRKQTSTKSEEASQAITEPEDPVEDYDVETPGDAEGIFVYYDRDGDGYLTKDEFRKALHGSGASPSAEAFERIWSSHKAEPNFEGFEKALRQLLTQRPDVLEFMQKVEAMTLNGKVDSDVMKYVVTHYGEPLDETEVDELLLAALPDKDGRIDAEQLGKTLLGY